MERDDTALEKVYKEEEEEEAEEEEDEEEEEEEEEGFTKKKKTKKHASTNRWQLSRTQHIKDSQDQILVPALGRKSLKTFQVPSSLGSGARYKNLSGSDTAITCPVQISPWFQPCPGQCLRYLKHVIPVRGYLKHVIPVQSPTRLT